MRKEVEEELRRTRDEALNVAQVKADFLANMSHEIRTPLNAIIGLAGLLVDTRLDPEQREYALTIRQAGDTLLEVINDILDFSKIEAGRLTLEEVVFEPRDTVAEAVQIISAAARAKGLDPCGGVRPAVPDARAWRSRAGPPGPAEPPEQRGQVHLGRRDPGWT